MVNRTAISNIADMVVVMAYLSDRVGEGCRPNPAGMPPRSVERVQRPAVARRGQRLKRRVNLTTNPRVCSAGKPRPAVERLSV
jgi:hypothetical protein